MPQIPISAVTPGYRSQSEDTSIDADVLMFQLLRQLTPQQRTQRFRHFNQATRKLTIIAIKNHYPNASLSRIYQEFIRRHLGSEWLTVLRLKTTEFEEKFRIEDPLKIASRMAILFETLSIPYLVGGSVASSLLGESRSTQDLDLVISISLSKAQQLIGAMEQEFYISESAVVEAVTEKRSFNVIHLTSLEKIDIFVIGDDAFSRSKMNRRQLYKIDESEKGIYIYSPEDIILQKLYWYLLSATESQKQWRDVLGVLKVQGERLDFNYLNQWAEILQVQSLLELALQQAGL
ncbi:hypothetical protein L2E68_22615 [Planktothrix agardhii 1029]|uniref:hypothetical protein n=1 Tax=Planktothrix agardhii TaxID=1160 RepID=UPI001D0A4A93|nr:hypothetical protein [Planktothrix agardhii]MCB8766601.1 hypothetical protein [Planktothrix agardhii 1809]MCB8780073.1 hypothetical protein [Planktothrix agardhii 1031]MCB8784548.1 hypothetical protein [Planktothrix agardhii 1808]MCF3568801.1 hypothetical protein [Planktothrix agardhii 1807]MCF3577768.1 hypothetical protein [Planktothrix agardhii 1812]